MRLREIRKEAGLTGRALAEAVGWHYTKVSRVETGGQTPSEQGIRAWCVACDAEDQISDLVATVRTIYSGDRRFLVVIEERALQARVGSAETMTGQLDRLLAVMSLPRVSLGIIPGNAPRRTFASVGFWIYDDATVGVETPTASLEVTQPREIQMYAKMFEQLKASAVYGKPARELVSNAITQLQNDADIDPGPLPRRA